jgi:hypothetical protein
VAQFALRPFLALDFIALSFRDVLDDSLEVSNDPVFIAYRVSIFADPQEAAVTSSYLRLKVGDFAFGLHLP